MEDEPRKTKSREGQSALSRRTFLQSVGIAAAAAGTGMVGMSSEAVAAAPDAERKLTAEELAIRAARERVHVPPSPLDKIHLEDFIRSIDTRFRVRAEAERTVELTCVSAEDHNARKVRGLDAFAVRFRGPSDDPLCDGIYTFSHGSLGDFDLHITPVGADAHGLLYQAAFCRFV